MTTHSTPLPDSVWQTVPHQPLYLPFKPSLLTRLFRPHLRSQIEIDHPDSVTPLAHLVITKPLIEKLWAYQRTHRRAIPQGEALRLALEDTSRVLAPFARDSLNVWNRSCYADRRAFSLLEGASRFFSKNREINVAFGGLLRSVFPNEPIHLKEIASGDRPQRWKDLLTSPVPHNNSWHITLSDFSLSALPSRLPSAENATFSKEVTDFLHPLPELPEEKRHHAFLATYAFDSIWLPEDRSYLKVHNQWYDALFRLSARSDFGGDACLRHLQHHNDIGIWDFQPSIAKEYLYQPIDMEYEEHAPLIEKRYAPFPVVACNIPGGLIRFVEEAFQKQIRSDGLFIIGDVTEQHWDRLHYLENPAFAYTGPVALFRVQDYALAKAVLEERGFYVAIIPILELCAQYGTGKVTDTREPTDAILFDEARTHTVMVISRVKRLL